VCSKYDLSVLPRKEKKKKEKKGCDDPWSKNIKKEIAAGTMYIRTQLVTYYY